jgi:hypothetical protein
LTVATVRHRTKVTKGPGSEAAGIAVAFKLIEAAQVRWRAVNAPHLVALVRAVARFDCGKLIERDPVLKATPSRHARDRRRGATGSHAVAGVVRDRVLSS